MKSICYSVDEKLIHQNMPPHGEGQDMWVRPLLLMQKTNTQNQKKFHGPYKRICLPGSKDDLLAYI